MCEQHKTIFGNQETADGELAEIGNAWQQLKQNFLLRKMQMIKWANGSCISG